MILRVYELIFLYSKNLCDKNYYLLSCYVPFTYNRRKLQKKTYALMIAEDWYIAG